MWIFLVLLVLADNHCYGSHFYGMSITWKPTSKVNTVDISFRTSWILSTYNCDDSTISSGTLTGEGELTCFHGYSGDIGSLEVKCTDFSTADDYMSGVNIITYTFSGSPENYYQFGYDSGDWRDLVQGSGLVWEVRASANLSVRADTGSINNSPVTAMPPVITLPAGCTHLISIPALDAEGDKVKCRFAEGNKSECGGICNVTGAQIDENACKLNFTPSSLADGWYGVALQIEDYYPGTNIVLSSVPLQFLIRVINVNCGSSPIFVEPTPSDGACIPFTSTYTEVLVARSQSNTASITAISTISPPGMTKTALAVYNGSSTDKFVTVSWRPTETQTGPAVYCFYATDSQGLQSSSVCVSIVSVERPAIVQKTPTGLISTSHIVWVIEVDSQISSPSVPTFVKFYKADGTLIHQVDVSKSSIAAYPSTITDRNVTITAEVPFEEFQEYYILLDSGVAQTQQHCRVPSTAITDVNFWKVITEGNNCTNGWNNCSEHANCTDLFNSFICECKDGFNGDGYNCSDINECSTNTDNCGANADCTNTEGAFICSCKSGYTGDGYNCSDIDECLTNTDNCSSGADCSNTIAGFNCSCKSGYIGDGYNCTDIDDCLTNTDNCSSNADCSNTVGGFNCTCKSGYIGDGFNCTDIDECETNTDNCSSNTDCSNTVGGFKCTCKSGYIGYGFNCTAKGINSGKIWPLILACILPITTTIIIVALLKVAIGFRGRRRIKPALEGLDDEK